MSILVLIIFPLLAALLTGLVKLPYRVKRVALGFSLIQLGYTLFVLSDFFHSAESKIRFLAPWLTQFGINWHFEMDGISMIMVLLTNLLIPFIIFSGIHQNPSRIRLLYPLILITQSALIGVFTSFNALVFYIFWEMALIPVFFILFLWGGERRQSVTLKFFIYTLFGSLFLLFVFIFLYYQTKIPQNFDYQSLQTVNLNNPRESWIFFLFLLAFFIKIPLFPTHSWQPETYNTAPFQGTMLLAALLMKMGVYGMIRWMLPVMPAYVSQFAPVLMFFALTGMIYASVIALRQQNLKMLVTFSSMAHAGLMGAAIFTGEELAIQGVLYQCFSHGIMIVALFYFVQLIEERTGTLNLGRLGGIKNSAQWFTALLLITVLGSVGLPLTSGFIGELLMIMGLYSYHPFFALLGALTIVLVAVYMLYAFQRVALGEPNPLTEGFTDLCKREKALLLPLIALILLFGLFPQPLLDLTGFSVQELLGLAQTFK